MIEKNKNKFPNWMEEFLKGFTKSADLEKDTEVEETNLVSENEINLKDLPTIVWNDDMFYISLDNGMATVINSFGNTVTSLKANTLEEVNELLNGKKIVTSIEEQSEKTAEVEEQPVSEESDLLEEELNKAMAYLETEDVKIANSIETQETHDIITAETIKNDSLEILLNKFAALEEKIETLNGHILNLEEQLYARTNPGNAYDINATEMETEHFNEAIEKSEESMELEKTIDLTTPKGRTVDYIEVKHNGEEIIPEVIEDETAENNVVEESDITEDETTVENETVVEKTEPEMLEKTTEESVAEDSEETEEVKDTKEAEKAEEVVNESEESYLNEEEAEIFKTAHCPKCNKELEITSEDDDYIYISCEDCKQHYKVSLNDEKIYFA